MLPRRARNDRNFPALSPHLDTNNRQAARRLKWTLHGNSSRQSAQGTEATMLQRT